MDWFTSIWKSIVLGTVQGLTEFLPVSSSGHLTFLQRVLGYDLGGGSMTFVNIMMHLGTLIAVVIAFRKSILALFKKPFKMLFMLIVATIPAGLAGVFLGDKIDEIFSGERALLYLALCFAFTGLILLIAEFVAKRQKKVRPLGWGNAVAMGVVQVVALLPGISRSGSTIVAGTVTGAKREDVAKFSFLMSIPIILGGFAVEVYDVAKTPEVVTSMGASGIVGVIIGVIFAAVFGFLAIKLMMRVISKANYMWFTIYLVLLSLTCFWLDALAVV